MRLTNNCEFIITEDHIKLLKASYVSWFDCEYGSPAIDPKRPYGNSFVAWDIALILGWELPKEDHQYDDMMKVISDRARKIHSELDIVLQILLANTDIGIQPGLYRYPGLYKVREWKFVETQT